MAKKLFFIAIAALLAVNLSAPAFCEEPAAKPDSPVAKSDNPASKISGPATKLGRGVANMVTFPLEIPEQISKVNNSDGPFAASTVGVLKGLGWAVGRACVGVFETVTFAFPVPNNYEAILKDPEYFLSDTTF